MGPRDSTKTYDHRRPRHSRRCTDLRHARDGLWPDRRGPDQEDVAPTGSASRGDHWPLQRDAPDRHPPRPGVIADDSGGRRDGRGGRDRSRPAADDASPIRTSCGPRAGLREPPQPGRTDQRGRPHRSFDLGWWRWFWRCWRRSEHRSRSWDRPQSQPEPAPATPASDISSSFTIATAVTSATVTLPAAVTSPGGSSGLGRPANRTGHLPT